MRPSLRFEHFCPLIRGACPVAPLPDSAPVGVSLTVSDGAGSWTVPVGTTISAGGYLSIAKDAAGFSALYGLDPDVEGMSISLNNDGDVVVLADKLGKWDLACLLEELPSERSPDFHQVVAKDLVKTSQLVDSAMGKSTMPDNDG